MMNLTLLDLNSTPSISAGSGRSFLLFSCVRYDFELEPTYFLHPGAINYFLLTH